MSAGVYCCPERAEEQLGPVPKAPGRCVLPQREEPGVLTLKEVPGVAVQPYG